MPTPVEWRRHYIEVKSSVGGEAVHLPRGEWGFASLHPFDWEMQIWIGDASEPVVVVFAEVAAHVPSDLGEGRWETVKVSCAALGSVVDNGVPGEDVAGPGPHTDRRKNIAAR